MVPRYVVKVELAALAGALNVADKTNRQTNRQRDRDCVSPREPDLMA